MVQEAADLAKKRKADVAARRQGNIARLEALRALVQKKEEEVRCFCTEAVHTIPDSRLPSFAICRVTGPGKGKWVNETYEVPPAIVLPPSKESHSGRKLDAIHQFVLSAQITESRPPGRLYHLSRDRWSILTVHRL